MSMSAEHKLLNKMKIVSEIFVNTLITVKNITEEIEQIAKIEIDNGNCSIENNEVYKKFNEIFETESITYLLSVIDPVVSEIDNEIIKTCEIHDYEEHRVETGLESDMMTIYCCKFCNSVKK